MSRLNKITFLLWVLIFVTHNARSNSNLFDLINEDTIHISYNIAYFGEYGSIDEGVMIYKDEKVLKAIYVKYNRNNFNSSSFELSKQKVEEYFANMENDYEVIKDSWILDTSQIDFLNQLLDDFKNYTPEDGVSNAAEFYQLNTNNNKHIIIDRLGSWDKYKEIHQAFNIEVKVPRRLYFLRIKLKDREVEYILN